MKSSSSQSPVKSSSNRLSASDRRSDPVLRSANSESPDRISNLSDSELGHILSFLDTSTAIRTSILSKRWISAWTHSFSIQFGHEDIAKCGGIDAFHDRLDSILRPRGEDRCIRIVRLQAEYGDYDPVRLATWISLVITSNDVEEFDLALDSDHRGSFAVPRDLFQCNTLVVLKLSGSQIVLCVPPKDHVFPRLKVLHLSSIKYGRDNSISQILARCPVIDELLVEGNDSDGINDYVIKAPSLKILTVIIPESWIQDTVTLKKLRSLVHARFELCPALELEEDDFRGSSEILEGVRNVRFLELSRYAVGVLRHDVLSGFPLFRNLVKLNLDGFCCSWDLLKEFFESCPLLKHLILGKAIDPICPCENPEDWEDPPEVPICLSSHLTTVSFQDRFWYDFYDSDLDFVKYILGNSLVLEKMTISFWHGFDPAEKPHAQETINMYPKGSEKCSIQFI